MILTTCRKFRFRWRALDDVALQRLGRFGQLRRALLYLALYIFEPARFSAAPQGWRASDVRP